MQNKVVIDTNALVSAVSSRSIFHWLVDRILDETLQVFITDEILLEYEEILKQKYSATVANNFLIALKELPNVHFTRIYYRWNILKDADDNKFVDCFIAANAHYLITNDNGFNVVKSLAFPPVRLVTLEEFGALMDK